MKQFIVLIEIDKMTDWLQDKKHESNSALVFNTMSDANVFLSEGTFKTINEFVFGLNMQMIDIEEYFVFNVIINEGN